MLAKRIWTAVCMAALVGVLAGACNLKSGSGDAPVPLDGKTAPVDLSVKVTDAPTTGALAGNVIDATGAPVANATVTAGGATATTDSSGAFSLTPTPGRAVLIVKAMGKVTFTQSIGVTSEAAYTSISLVASSAPQAVPAGGGKVTAGNASLDIPNGAYPSGVTLNATWIDLTQVPAASGPLIFLDDNGTHRFVGQIHIEAPSEPAAPVTLRVPSPTGGTPVLYEIKDGEPSGRILPKSTDAAMASFVVPHFSTFGMFVEIASGAAPETSWLLAAGTITDDKGNVYKPGQKLPAGIRVAKGAPFRVVSSNGATIRSDGTSMQLDTEADGTTSTTCIELCKVQADVPPKPPAPPGLKKYQIRTKTATLGSRATVFSIRQKPCSGSDGTAIDTVETSEGDVDFNVGGEHFEVPAGKQAKGCDGCKDPKQAMCDCDGTAGEAAGGECLKCPGESPQARGLLIEGSPFCVPKNSVSCARDGGHFVAVCSDPRGVCQCAGKSQAGCATRNSLCVTDRSGDRSGDRILDCGLTPEQPLACEKALEGVRTLWSCDGLEAYLRDVNNCGSCGHKCPRKNYVCDAGKCVDCNNGCGDDKVYCGNFKSCCALSPANGVDVTTCYTSPDDPAPGCSASGYQVPRRPGTSSCFP